MRTTLLILTKRSHPARRVKTLAACPKSEAGSKAELLPALLPVPKRGVE